MLHKFRKFCYDNKIKIWRGIFIIASILIVIQLANYLIKIRSENSIKNVNNSDNINSNTTNTNIYMSSNTSGVTGEIIDKDSLAQANEIIDNFISACNNSNIEEAYSYLSKECKNEMFNNLNDFKTLYFDPIFGGVRKNATIENWLLNTYKINISEDIMTTGNVNNIKTQDYITVTREGNEIKLNINNFAGIEKINKNQEINGINFIILNKKMYMDYEEYDLIVENNTNGKILLDSLQNTKAIYIQDNNNTKYYSYSHELLSNLLEINSGFLTHITIKFSKQYSIERETKNIVFSNVIFYDNNGNTNIQQVEINL